MAQIKAGQVKLVAEGDLIIGNAGANSSILSIGAASQVVISNGTTGAWDYLEDLRASGTGELIIDGVGIGSAINHLKVTNSITGNPVLVESVGADTNINLELTSKGTGRLKLDGTLWPNAGVAARSILATQNGAPDDLVAITSPDGSGDQILLYNDTTNTLEWVSSSTLGGAVFKTVAGDIGSAIAEGSTDTLTIAGGEAIVTTVTDDPEILIIDLDIVGLITITPIVDREDSIVVYDVSTATHAKVTINQFLVDLEVGVVQYSSAVANGGANESFVTFFNFIPLSDEAIIVFFNGLALRDTGWTRSALDLTLVDSINGYSTESGDIISSRYETADLSP